MTTRRLLAAGTLGSALVAVGGWGSGALPPGVQPWGPGTPLVVLGVLLLGASWWRLRTGALRAALLWSAPLLLAPPLFSRDAYAYVGQAALVVEGRDPYDTGPAALSGPLVDGVDDVWRDTPSPYGPLWLALAGAVVRVTGDRLLPALVGMRLLAVLGLLLAGWALHRLGGERAVWLGVANPLVLLHLVAGAHNEALMLGLALAGLAVAAAPLAGGGPARGGLAAASVALAAVLITLGALVKLPVIALLAPLVLAVPGGWPGRARAAAVAGAAAAVTAGLVSAGTGLGWGWLGTLDAGRARLSLFSVTTGLGTLLPGGDAALEAVLGLGLLLGAGVAAALLWRTPALGAARAGGLALLAVALLLPVVQPWYVLWGVLPLAAAAGTQLAAAGTRVQLAPAGPRIADGPPPPGAARPPLAAAVGALCLVLCLLVWPSGRSVVRPPLYGVPTLLAVGAAVLVLQRGRRRPSDVEEGGHPAAPVTRQPLDRR